MDLKTVFFLLLIVLALILIALHVYDYYVLPKECTLLQREKLEHDQWKTLIKEKQPLIIRQGVDTNQPILEGDDSSPQVSKDCLATLESWTSSLCTHRNHDVHLLTQETQHPPVRVFAHDNLYLVEQGAVHFQLYLPKEYHKLRKTNSRDGILVSPRIVKCYDGSNRDDVEHVEVIIRAGQVLSIPPQFVYSYHATGSAENPVRLIHLVGQTPITHLLAWLKIG